MRTAILDLDHDRFERERRVGRVIDLADQPLGPVLDGPASVLVDVDGAVAEGRRPVGGWEHPGARPVAEMDRKEPAAGGCEETERVPAGSHGVFDVDLEPEAVGRRQKPVETRRLPEATG